MIAASKRCTLYEFFQTYVSTQPLGDAVADLARDVRHDAKAPRRNTVLIDYLLRRGIDARLIDRAVQLWKAARNG